MAAANLEIIPKELVVVPASQILAESWIKGGGIVVVGAIGAVTRLIAPLLKSKEEDPAVVVVDARGMNFIPLLGGHNAGAEELAIELAEVLGGKAVITGNSRQQEFLPLDSFGNAWGWKRTGNSEVWKQLMLHQANEGDITIEQSSGSNLWLSSKGAINSLKGQKQNQISDAKCLYIGPNAFQDASWHPSTLWIGIGCERNTSVALIKYALESALEQVGLVKEAVAGLASIELKNDEQALISLSEEEEWPIRFFSALELSKVLVPNPSEVVKEVVRTPSVAEASALLSAGKGSRLLKKKQVFKDLGGFRGAVTIAIAEAMKPFSPQCGELHLIGSGPGNLSYLTHDARAALSRSVVWIGYKPYLDFLEPLRSCNQVRSDSQLSLEKERCKYALDLAMQGIRVALISSGESGIYGMAGLALELWLDEPQEERPAFEIHPGISCIQVAAARIGAPLMNDFCAISLSDKLTSWETILQRLKGAAIGDFVITIYNPRSNDRNWQLQVAIDLIRQYRSLNTPIAIARQIGRPQESLSFYQLDNIPFEEIDMLTVVLIGNSKTFLKDDCLVSPRGYSIESNSNRDDRI